MFDYCPPEIPDPSKFGWQADGSYAPSPSEIRAACWSLQATWDEHEHHKRRVEPDYSATTMRCAVVFD